MRMSLLLLLSHFQHLSVNLAVSRRKATAFNSSTNCGSSSVSISQCQLFSGSSGKVSCFLWYKSPAKLFSDEVHALGNICSFKTFSFTTCPLLLYVLAQLKETYWFFFFFSVNVLFSGRGAAACRGQKTAQRRLFSHSVRFDGKCLNLLKIISPAQFPKFAFGAWVGVMVSETGFLSVCGPGCPGTHFVAQAGLRLREICLPWPGVLGLEVCVAHLY